MNTIRLVALLLCCVLLTACSPTVAQERQFLDLSADFLGTVEVSQAEFEETPIGGLSGLTFDRQTQKFYAISDDRANLSPARFYTLSLDWPNPDAAPQEITVEQVTTLKDAAGEPFAPGTIDAEAIALSPRNTLFISSEGDVKNKIAPWIKEFDRATGQEVSTVRLPARFLPETPIRNEDPPHGVQNNLALESLTLNWTGLSAEDPFRLFTAPEAPLVQDRIPPESDAKQGRLRLLHYVVNPVGEPVLVSENAYLLEPPPDFALAHGLSELLALDTEGYLLSLERSFGLRGIDAKLFQVIAGNATDTSRIAVLGGPLQTVQTLNKRLLLDLRDLNISLDNLEGLTIGPRLPDGSQLLVLVSDNNFSADQVTQFLFFRLIGT